MRYILIIDGGVGSPDPTPIAYDGSCRVGSPGSTVRYLLIIALLFLFVSPALAERYEYYAEVNQVIPDFDSVGVTDTIFIPVHAVIEDINFFVGIGDMPEPWAEEIWVDVFSPAGGAVRLNGIALPRIHWFLVWYDTEREVDGPGHLSDYEGLDCYGPWIMHAFDLFPNYISTWHTWRIEVYGQPITGLNGQEKPDIPTDFTLDGNYPNPFNSATTVKLGVPQTANVTITIFDILGRKVRTVADREFGPGYHRVLWDGNDGSYRAVSSGIYLIRMQSGDRVFHSRAVLLK
ncbi:MAG: T9SS type A sorting domain-containing protein [Candidatus Zixiibacteriota bacterium]|nr:MAG: T9SS type A sorting domain-containing protein [candidate division Zixibacteria bacterium]